jgi:hypothetical protein
VRRQRALGIWLPVVLCVVAGGVAAAVLARQTDPTPVRAPLDVQAQSIFAFTTIGEMTAASDLVVVGSVAAVAEGRLIGSPGGTSVRSQFTTITVQRVLAGVAPAAVVIEEEAALADGTPITVNGVAPSEVGDRAVWFLDQLEGEESPVYLVINSQGRVLDEGGRAVGGDQRDALVQAIQRLGFDAVIAEVCAAVAGTGHSASGCEVT